MDDYYDRLGVQPDATPALIRITFEGRMKALAREKLPEAERRAEEKRLQEAFAVLSNPAKRAWYDKQRAGEAAAPAAKSWRGPVLVLGMAATAAGFGAWMHAAGKNEQAEAERAARRDREARAAREAIEERGPRGGPNPFREGPPSDTQQRIMKQMIEKEAQRMAKEAEAPPPKQP